MLDDTVKCWNDKQKVSFAKVPNRDLHNNFDKIKDVKVIDIAAGYFHTCAVRASDNQIQCWGDNSENQITEITDVFQGKKVRAISAGAKNLCAIMMDNTVLCSNESFRLKQKVKTLKVNGQHGCAITFDNKLICFGKKPSDPHSTFANKIEDKKVSYVALGEDHICAILEKNNEMHCFGSNNNYTELDSKIVKERPYKSVFAGRFHTCAVDLSNKIKCFGFDKTFAHIVDIQGQVLK